MLIVKMTMEELRGPINTEMARAQVQVLIYDTNDIWEVYLTL